MSILSAFSDNGIDLPYKIKKLLVNSQIYPTNYSSLATLWHVVVSRPCRPNTSLAGRRLAADCSCRACVVSSASYCRSSMSV